MTWLMALLAFAGIMAVLATIVSTLVELFHKVAASRHGGLSAMCRSLYPALNAAFARDGGVGVAGLTPERFAQIMTNRPMPQGAAPSGSALPFRGAAGARFERLTPLQYVEQLANTDIGDRLAEASPSSLRRSLHHAVYQFERYGHAQSAYFRRRTKLISGAVAFLVVAIGNINGFAIYQHLARSPDAASAAIAFVSSPQAMELEGHALAARQQVEALSLQLEAAQAAPSGISSNALAAALEAAQGRLTLLNTELDAAQTELAANQRLTLPIGWSQFPYCMPANGEGAQPSACSQAPQRLTIGEGTVAASYLGGLGFWLVSLIGTAGLLALGAPFWFDAFRALAALTVASRGAQALAERGRAPPNVDRAASGAVRDGNRADPDALVEAFQSARGVVSGYGESAYGRRLGDSSAEAVPAVAVAQGRIRPVRQ
jgi:hypothetical protein